MRTLTRIVAAGVGAVALVALLVAGILLIPSPSASVLSRREMFVGILALGVFGLVAYGFDVRDWF